MKPLPQSGTAPRAAASGALSVLAGVGGHAAGGPVGAAGAVLTPAVMARILMSNPVQGWLGNQALARPAAAYQPATVRQLAPQILKISEEQKK